jgi:dTDP-4-amino-4,6-dideoxygalactose transaminase
VTSEATGEEWTVPLSDLSFTSEEVQALAETYRSGWLSQGPKVEAFEAAFAEYLGSPHAVAVSSGTAALQLICAALGLGAGDEVLLPSLTFAASAAAVFHTGATPVFVDIAGLQRPWLSAEAVERALSTRTRAILNVAYAGHPGESLALRELADAHGVALIEDAAHALGTRVDGRHVGTIGAAGAFSFFANKNMALGEGGMLATSDPQLARTARLLRSHGLSSDTWSRHRGDDVDYDVLAVGFNFRLDEARAALGLLTLRRLDEDNRRRSAAAEAYARGLRSVAGVRSAIDWGSSGTHAVHIYPLLLDDGLERSAFRAQLRARRVQTSVHYPPLHLTKAFARPDRGPLELTEEYARRTVSVPLFQTITGAQQDHVIEAIEAACATLTP